jgi:formylglycine-generating enzyme required for sulfatase activity
MEDGEDKEKTDAKDRLLRGGSNVDHAASVRCAFRFGVAPATRFGSGGLRPARTYR